MGHHVERDVALFYSRRLKVMASESKKCQILWVDFTSSYGMYRSFLP
jgi:hypothetical protein